MSSFRLGDHQRIDLEQAHVLGDEGRVELGDERFRLLGELAGQPQGLRHAPAVMRHDAGRRIDREGHDLLRDGSCATSSMSMPPSVETTKAMRDVSRSTSAER